MTKKKQDLPKTHLEAISRLSASISAEGRERNLCIEDQKFVFVEGSQWDSLGKNKRSDRPRYTSNKVAVPVNQIIGEQRMNRITVKVRPLTDGASKDTAEVMGGLINNITTQSKFDTIKDIAFKEMVSGGFGAWQVGVGYAKEDSFKQSVVLKPIRSAASSVYYDPSAVLESKQDATWFLVTEDISLDAFEMKYPGKTPSSVEMNKSYSYLIDWHTRDTVRIADYWVKEPYIKTLTLLSDGRTMEINDETIKIIDELANPQPEIDPTSGLPGLVKEPVTVVKQRQRTCNKIIHYKLSAGEIIDGPHEWAGSLIPIVPIFGFNSWIEGQHYYRGMVRPAKDPQRIYNYAISHAIEVSALTPADPIYYDPRQIESHEHKYENFPNSNSMFLPFNHTPEMPNPPTRGGAPAVQQAILAQVQQADMDIQATTGLYSPTLGEQQTDQSGKAILALQKQSNASTYELVDNLNKAVQQTGNILIDLIPKIYDTEQQVTILAEDGSSTIVTLNQTMKDEESGKDISVVDLSLGEYDIVSTTGPSFATKRSETLNLLSRLAENPAFAAIANDLIAQNIDFDQADELHKRMRRQMIAQGIIEMNEEEQQEAMNQPQPQPSAMDQMMFKQKQLELENLAGIVDNVEMQNRKLQADLEHKLAETQQQLTDTIETKVDINTKLDDRGQTDVNIPIEEEELAARQKNLRILNENLEMSIEDVQKLEQMEIQDGQQPPQLPGSTPSQYRGEE